MATSRPNIILVMADQMRASALGCAGIEGVQTPHLDRFAAEGTRFTRAASNTPVCGPARASLLTGLHTLSHGVVFNDLPLRTDVPSLAHELNALGYRCGYIGKWHLDIADRGIFVPPGPRRQGFDDYWASANCTHKYSTPFLYLNDDPNPVWPDGYEPEVQTDLAVDYLSARAGGDDPFCLVLSWGPPHCPYLDVPQRYLDRYPPEEITLLPNAAPEADRRIIAGYYALISVLDDCFGRLLAAIDAAGIADNTLVIFMSDHGDMLFSQNRGWKCKPWWESVGIPLLMRWPGEVPAGRVTDGPISIVDLMPTLLRLAGGAVPPGVEGEDLSAFVRGDDNACAASAFINLPLCLPAYSFSAWRGVVTRTHTYARFQDRPWVLYDDAADPFQRRNLAEAPDAAPLREEMEACLTGWLRRTNDSFSSSREVADRYCPGHQDLKMPYYYNAVIQQGYAARRQQQA